MIREGIAADEVEPYLYARAWLTDAARLLGRTPEVLAAELVDTMLRSGAIVLRGGCRSPAPGRQRHRQERDLPSRSDALAVCGAREPRGMSFRLSFHLALLGPTGADWLDDPSDLSCRDSTDQHAVDGPRLSCKQLVPVRVRRSSRNNRSEPCTPTLLVLPRATDVGQPCFLTTCPSEPNVKRDE
jgi:hypothetical protein